MSKIPKYTVCPYCGTTKISDHYVFCRKCGEEWGLDELVETADETDRALWCWLYAMDEGIENKRREGAWVAYAHLVAARHVLVLYLDHAWGME
jgi:hypothetical protein